MMRLLGNFNEWEREEVLEFFDRSKRIVDQSGQAWKAGSRIAERYSQKNPLKRMDKADVAVQALFIITTVGNTYVSEIDPDSYSMTTQRTWKAVRSVTQVAACITGKGSADWRIPDYLDVIDSAVNGIYENKDTITDNTLISDDSIHKFHTRWTKISTICRASYGIYDHIFGDDWFLKDKTDDYKRSNMIKNAFIIVTTTGDVWVNDIAKGEFSREAQFFTGVAADTSQNVTFRDDGTVVLSNLFFTTTVSAMTRANN